jgi:hypothetical protein
MLRVNSIATKANYRISQIKQVKDEGNNTEM